MTQCPFCHSEVDANNPIHSIVALRKWVENEGGWSIFESDSETYGYPVGKTFLVSGGEAKVAAKKVSYDSGDIDTSYYDELPQGTTFDTYVVIEYSGNFYKKSGSGDSYGEISWDGELLPVVPKVKTVQVYEFN
jgi:hypothetical protein